MSIDIETIGRPVWLLNRESEEGQANFAADNFLAANQLATLGELLDICGGKAQILNEIKEQGLFSTEVGDGVFCSAFEIDSEKIFLTIQPRTLQHRAAEDTLLALGKLGAKLGHDFNNILGSIQGCVELVRAKIHSGAPRESFDRPLKILDSALSKSVLLTDKIRGFARQEVGECSLKDALANALTSCRKIVPNFSIEIPRQPPACRVPVPGNQFEQILITVFLNAFEASPGSATAEFSANGESLEIVVQDRGTGFSPAAIQQLFDPFYSSKSGEIGKGYGLGLAMANKILQLADGQLAVKNTEQGAEVRIIVKVII